MTSQLIPKPSSSPLGSKGFTLVELAVVLIILGAIFMSVLKVESMVKNAKIRQMVSMYRELRTAIIVYKDKYGYLPGDDKYAFVHVGVPNLGDGNGIYNLNEYLYVTAHLSSAGLIKGFYNGKAIATPTEEFPFGFPESKLSHPFNGHTLIGYHAIPSGNLKSGNAIRFDNIPIDAAQALDTLLDDGQYDTGFIRGVDLNLSGFVVTPRDYTTSVSLINRYCAICFFE